MIPASCKRLIEVDFPIAAVSAHSAREKSIRHGHPSTLHLWWARRPLAACRSVLLGLLLPDPCETDCPADFKTTARELLAKRYSFQSCSSRREEAQTSVTHHASRIMGEQSLVTSAATDEDLELRELLLKFIGEFANWDHAGNALYLEIGRGLVKAAHPEETPVVVDPFAGGGSIPLEALRLGCEAFASDLNPVACLILKTLLEDIPRYGNAEFKLPRSLNVERSEQAGKRSTSNAQRSTSNEDEFVTIHGLADALRHVGKQVKAAAEKELAQFYPPDPDGSRPIAYLWARTVRCEGIGCGLEIPLVRSFWLSKKTERRRAFRYKVERHKKGAPELKFEIFQPKSESEVPAGTVSRANATCPCCGTVLPAERVRSQVVAQRGGADVAFDNLGNRIGGALLLAVVIVHDNLASRQYRLPTARDYEVTFAAKRAVGRLLHDAVPTEPIPTTELRRVAVPLYGVKTWGDMFTARQKLAMTTLAKLINSIASGSTEAKAVKRFAGLALSRFSDICNAFCRWENTKTQVRDLFGRQAVPMLWDFAEPDIFGDNAGDYCTTLETMIRVVERVGELGWPTIGRVETADAAASPLPAQASSVWFTDPPYYDSVPYAHLSDFFYVWLKRVPNDDTGKWFEATLTSKNAECVVDRPHSLSNSTKTPSYYESKMADAMREGRRVLRQDGVGCVVFAHKTTEGWEALLSGILRCWFRHHGFMADYNRNGESDGRA